MPSGKHQVCPNLDWIRPPECSERVDGGLSPIVRKSAAVGGFPAFARIRSDDKVAPIAVARAGARKRAGSTRFRHAVGLVLDDPRPRCIRLVTLSALPGLPEYATFMGSPSTFQRTFSALLLRRNIVSEEAIGWLTSWGNSPGPRYTKPAFRALPRSPTPDLLPSFPCLRPPHRPGLRPLEHTSGPVKSSIDPRSASTCG
jgi:hypothetical protein